MAAYKVFLDDVFYRWMYGDEQYVVKQMGTTEGADLEKALPAGTRETSRGDSAEPPRLYFRSRGRSRGTPQPCSLWRTVGGCYALDYQLDSAVYVTPLGSGCEVAVAVGGPVYKEMDVPVIQLAIEDAILATADAIRKARGGS